MSEPTRVFVVDDHPIVRVGIVQMLKEMEGLVVCGEATESGEAEKLILPGEVDLVVLDILLKRQSGIDLLKRLTSRDSKLKVLVLSMMDGEVYAERALKAGAAGFVMKEQATDELAIAIQTILAGERYLNAELEERLRLGAGGPGPGFDLIKKLSNRELHIFELIGSGMATREIGKELSISPRTVDAHKEHIKRKLEASSAAQLANVAIRWRQRHQGLGGEGI